MCKGSKAGAQVQRSGSPLSTLLHCMVAPRWTCPGAHQGMAHTHGCSQEAGWVRLQTFWLPSLYTVLQHCPGKICILLNAYSCAIMWCKQFLLWVSCCENTSVAGSNTALTAFRYHGTTEEDTKDDGSVLMSPLAAQYGPEETQDQVLCSMDLTRSFGLRPALFSTNFNTSLAIQTQLKTTLTNSAFHMRTRRGNGPSSLQCTHCVIALLSPRWKKPPENSSANAQPSEWTSKWKTTVLQSNLLSARNADYQGKKLEQDLEQNECPRKQLCMQKWLR